MKHAFWYAMLLCLFTASVTNAETGVPGTPTYVIGMSDVLDVSQNVKPQSGVGPAIKKWRRSVVVRPDGTIDLPSGKLFVAGKTTADVEKLLAKHWNDTNLIPQVSLFANNSKNYYIIFANGTDGGSHIHSHPWTGKETVIDLFARVQDNVRLRPDSAFWIARPKPGSNEFEKLPIRLADLHQGSATHNDPRIEAFDRLFMQNVDYVDATPTGSKSSSK